MKVYGVTGWKNSGKTTLLSKLVEEIVGRGVSVSTVKHAHHAFDIDHEGKDSWRHRQAGAREVLVSSRKRWALMHENADGEDEPPLAEMLSKLAPVQLALVEGYKRDDHPKVEAFRLERGHPLIAPEEPSIRAIAADVGVETLRERGLDPSTPVFNLDDVAGIASFILRETEVEPGR